MESDQTDRVKVSSHPGWFAVRRVVRADELSLTDDAVFFLRERVSSWKAEMEFDSREFIWKLTAFA